MLARALASKTWTTSSRPRVTTGSRSRPRWRGCAGPWSSLWPPSRSSPSWGWWLVGRNARWWGYAEREDELYIKHGALFRTLVVVPYGRMQYVDVQAGPLEQAFKIASVHLHTASPGTSARIPGLPAAEAARLRDRLTSLGESQAAGL